MIDKWFVKVGLKPNASNANTEYRSLWRKSNERKTNSVDVLLPLNQHPDQKTQVPLVVSSGLLFVPLFQNYTKITSSYMAAMREASQIANCANVT